MSGTCFSHEMPCPTDYVTVICKKGKRMKIKQTLISRMRGVKQETTNPGVITLNQVSERVLSKIVEWLERYHVGNNSFKSILHLLILND